MSYKVGSNYQAIGGDNWVVGGTLNVNGNVNLNGNNITPRLGALNLESIIFQVEDLAADADIANRPVLVIPTGYKFTIESANIISLGTAAGINDSNTSVFELRVGATVKTTRTFNTATTFPASGAATTMTVPDGNLAAGNVLTLSVTNGTAANPPAAIVQINGYYEKV